MKCTKCGQENFTVLTIDETNPKIKVCYNCLPKQNIETETFQVEDELIEEAKQYIKEFDKVKSYDKFLYSKNWIGYVGEEIFKRFLMREAIGFEHIKIGTGTPDSPDFIIDGKTFDVKTTQKLRLMTQKPKHDYYVSIFYNETNQTCKIVGFISKEKILKLIECWACQRKSRRGYNYNANTRSCITCDYYFDFKQLDPIKCFESLVCKRKQ